MKSLIVMVALAFMVTGCDKKEAPQPYGKPVARAQVKDPVCGMMIDSDKSKVHAYQDVKYYFCSQTCHDDFEKSPQTYVKITK